MLFPRLAARRVVSTPLAASIYVIVYLSTFISIGRAGLLFWLPQPVNSSRYDVALMY